MTKIQLPAPWRVLWFSLAVIAAVVSGGCAQKEKDSGLLEAAKLYVQAIRWGEFGVASKMIRNRDGTPAPGVALPPESLRIVHYDYRVGPLPTDPNEAVMRATFKYYYDDAGIVREETQESSWWYDQEARQWWMEGSLPNFTR